MGVDNRSSKKAVISFRFCVNSKSGQARNVDGKLEVAAGKFKKWKTEQSEEEKKENTSIFSFAIGEKLFEIEEKGKYWFLQIEDNNNGQKPILYKYLDTYYEDEGRLPNSVVAQRIREFSNYREVPVNKTTTQLLQSWINSRRNTE